MPVIFIARIKTTYFDVESKMSKDDHVMAVSTYETSGALKAYSFLEFIDLTDLKNQLNQNGYRSVHLREFGAFDDYGCLVKQDIAIGNIHIDYINWCNSEGNRHLELSRK